MANGVKSSDRSGLKKTGMAALILVLIYGLFGFFAAPSILEDKLTSILSEQLGRKVTVRKIKVNPFALSLKIEGFEISEQNGGRFAGFEALFINFQLSSIIRRAYTFNEIILTEPDGRLVILSDGRMNVSDLIPPSEAAPAASTPNQKKEEGIPPVIVFHLQIVGGQLVFNDRSRQTPFEAVLSPIKISLPNFSTLKDSENQYAFQATSKAGEHFKWTGNFSIDPFRVKGQFTFSDFKARTIWDYIQDFVLIEVTDGKIDIAADYDLDTSGQALRLKLSEGKVDITDFELVEKSSQTSWVSVPKLSISGTEIDLGKRQAVVVSIRSSSARLNGLMNSEGILNVQRLWVEEKVTPPVQPSDPSQDASVEASEPWQFTLQEITLDNYEVTFEDQRFEKPFQHKLRAINANLKNLSNRKNAQTDVKLALTVNASGTLDIKGKAGINPVFSNIDLKLEKIPLLPFQPYLDSVVQLDFVSGTANLDGHLKTQNPELEGPEIRFEGDARIDGFSAVDQSRFADLLKWEALVFKKMAVEIGPNQLSISEIKAEKPYAKLIISPDQSTNLSRAFSSQENQNEDAEMAEPDPIEKEEAMPITIGAIRIEDGSVNYADQLIKPNFAIGIQHLRGAVVGLYSDPSSRADVLLEGEVDEYAPVKISGQINPLGGDLYLDLALLFNNFELTSLTPFSGKFVGYAVEKGKMSLDIKSKISDNKLLGEHKLLLDQFTLGKEIDSPDATRLPVKLAIALLKDRSGKIEIDLPVEGDLDDPEFSYGGIVMRALVNLLTKIVTSPFALLGGGGEELSRIEFDFGQSLLRPQEIAKLDQMAKALDKKPALQVGIQGTADPKLDRTLLAEAELLNQLKQAKLKELKASGGEMPARIEDVSLTEAEIARLMTQIYEARFAESPELLVEASETPEVVEEDGQSDQTTISKEGLPPVDPELIIAAAKKRLIQDIPIDENHLRELSQERARQIRNYLISEGKVSENRLFMIEVEIKKVSEGASIGSELTLSAN